MSIIEKCLRDNQIQIPGKIPTKKEIQEINEYISKHPETGLRFYWYEPNDDLSFIAEFKKVRHLEAGGSNIEYLRQLEDLESLKTGPGEDLSLEPLASLKKLKKLGIHSNKATDLTPLQSLTNLEELDISGKFKNLQILAELNKIVALKTNFTIKDPQEFFSYFPNLEYYYTSKGINNFSGIENCKKLKYLHINHISKVTEENLKPISKCISLETLRIDYLPLVTNFKWLKESPIKMLFIAFLNGLLSLDGVEKLKNLEIFGATGGFKNTKTINASALLGAPSLKKIHISGPLTTPAKKTELLDKLRQENIETDLSINWLNLNEYQKAKEYLKELSKNNTK